MAERVNTVIVGGGQAGLAMSAHLGTRGVDHLVLERDRIAERWRSARWDSLVANGPAWHDRFPAREFAGIGGAISPHAMMSLPISRASPKPSRLGALRGRGDVSDPPAWRCRLSCRDIQGPVEADNVVAATGPFQTPVIPPLVPETTGLCRFIRRSIAIRTSLARAVFLLSVPDPPDRRLPMNFSIRPRCLPVGRAA